jgi:predicted O-methyltransferase YrrM
MKQEEILRQIPTAWTDHITFAKWLVEKINPEVIVDLGVDYGYSTFCFALPNIGTVYGIDSFEGDPMAGMKSTYDYVRERRDELGLKNVKFIKGYFGLVARDWQRPIDILHIDGYHTFQAVKSDYDTWSQFVKDDGVILFHDTCVREADYEVYKFFEELQLPKVNFTCSHGLGVVSLNEDLIREIKTTFNL